jgi:hypothetical protein
MTAVALQLGCPNATTCSLLCELRESHALQVVRAFYCESSFERCLRYRLLLSGEPVRPDLLPDGRNAAGLRLARAA